MYIRNKNEPIIDPSGTPQLLSLNSELKLVIVTNCVLFLRYEENQLFLLPLTPCYIFLVKNCMMNSIKSFLKIRVQSRLSKIPNFHKSLAGASFEQPRIYYHNIQISLFYILQFKSSYYFNVQLPQFINFLYFLKTRLQQLVFNFILAILGTLDQLQTL